MLATAAVAALVWLITEAGFGHDLAAPGMDIGLGMVVVTASVAGLAALASLALLERWVRRPVLVWRTLAVVVLVLSLGGPLSGTGVEVADRSILALLHIVVGGGLIVGLPRAGKESK